jgi:tetratricopeptide (TPR) repeat protein
MVSMFLLLACTSTDPLVPAGPPSIVLVTLDTTRADRLGAYGDPLAQTPHLDGLALQSALFRNAITPVPLTLPAHASMFTGLYPDEHGLRDNASGSLSPSHPHVAEDLQGMGYATGAFVSAYVVAPGKGLERGFDDYGDPGTERAAAQTVDAALAWWDGTEGPRFLWVHLFDAHRPYVATGQTGDAYRDEVAVLDVAVGRILDSVGEDTAVVVAADHGENLWDGSELEHGMVLTRSVLRVPLLVRPPGGLEAEAPVEDRAAVPRPEGWIPIPEIDDAVFKLEAVPDAPRAARVIETPVSLVGIADTLRNLAGMAAPSLLDAVGPVRSESLYSLIHYGWAPSFFALDGAEGLLRSPADQGIAWNEDPWWRSDAGPRPELSTLLDAHQGLQENEGDKVDRQLAALGYTTVRVEATDTLLAPATQMPKLHRVFIAQGKMASAPDDALAELEAVLSEDPRLVDAWFSVAQLRVNQMDREGAIAALDQLLAVAPSHHNALVMKLALTEALGDTERSLEVVEAMVRARPEEPSVHHQRFQLLVALGRDPLPALKQSLELLPGDCVLTAELVSRQVETDPSGALDTLSSAEGCTTLDRVHAQTLLALDRPAEAVPLLERWIASHPDDLAAMGTYTTALVQSDACETALPLLERLYTARRDRDVLAQYRACGGTGF